MALTALITLTTPSRAVTAEELADYRNAIENVLQAMDAQPMDEHWFFTITLAQGDEVQIIQSSPLREEPLRRQLISVNGSPPSQKQLEKHAAQEKKRIEDEAAEGDENGYGYLVDSSTLSMATTSAATDTAAPSGQGQLIELNFSPRIKAFEDDQSKLQGSLLFNIEQNTVEKISVHNTAKLSPAFSVSLTNYQMELVFSLLQAHQLLQQMNTTLQGKYGFMKKFDSKINIQFSDFRRHSS